MINVLARIEVAKWCAKDLHYSMCGNYGAHLLADKLDFGDNSDALKEIYYLGEKGESVPADYDISKLSMQFYEAIEPVTTTCGEGVDIAKHVADLKQRLLTACIALAYEIEEAKRVYMPMGGTCSVLDEISAVTLTVAGLCRKSLA